MIRLTNKNLAVIFKKMRLLPILLILSFSIVVITPVFAQESTPSTTRREKTEQRVEERKERVQERIGERKDKVASRAAAVKEKIQAFKDKRKAQATERINENLDKVNQQKTSALLRHLERMSALIIKLENVVSKQPEKDTSAAKASITTAKAQIESAKSVVNAQAAKSYSINVTTESKVKDDAKVARDSLHSDLKTAHTAVVDARKSVENAISTTRSSLGGKNGK